MTPSHSRPGGLINERIANVARALSSPPRVRVINLLAQSPRGVDELAAMLGQSEATTSAQLKVLREAGLVERRAQGRRALYQVASEGALRVWMSLRDFALTEDGASRLALQEVEAAAPVFADSLDELERRVAAGKLRLIDLRPREEFARGHLPGARSIPLESLPAELETLAQRPRYVVYGRGPYCARAVEGALLLSAGGHRVARLPAGIAEWRLAGRAIETET